MTRSLARLVAILAVVLSGSLAVASPALAHGGDETEEGYLLVQQALGHLAHDTSADGIDLAMEKVDDALNTEDQEGVAVPELQEAKAALVDGNVNQARSLLQDSIAEAVQGLPPATGIQTGTTTVTPELPGRSGLGAQDWSLLIASLLVLLLGIWLAFRFRPHESVRILRSRLAAAEGADEPAPGKEGH